MKLALAARLAGLANPAPDSALPEGPEVSREQTAAPDFSAYSNASTATTFTANITPSNPEVTVEQCY